jgi:hypothetical protein
VNNTYAVLGNHDIYPHWDFAKDQGNPATLESSEYWRAWLPVESEFENFKRTGYFIT